MQMSRLQRGALAVLLATAGFASHAATYSTLAIFGDSLSDSGNNALVLGSGGPVPSSNFYIPSGPAYASGTYSNGPVWVSSFATALGLPARGLPSIAGGGDWAAGGARTNDAVAYPPSATAQLASFLAPQPSLPSTGLYVIAIGGNDVRDTVTAVLGGAGPTTIAANAASYASAVGNMVDALQAKGAAHIVVWNAPDVGKTPVALSAGFSALASSVATAFNGALALRLAGEAGVTPFDVYGLVDSVSANPAAYGLTNVTDACGALINACSSSLSTAFFYDGIHPTTAGQAILSAAMLNAVAVPVPEPASLLMWAAGGLGLLLATRVRR